MFCFALGPTNHAANPVWDPEQSGEVRSSDFPGETRFYFPVVPLELQCCKSAVACWWICILLQCNTFPHRGKLIGALVMPCQGPRASPGAKRLRTGFKFNSGG